MFIIKDFRKLQQMWIKFPIQTFTPLLPNLDEISKEGINPNWHEAGHFYPPFNFEIGFCQLNLHQKFPNFFGGENLHQLF